MARPPFGLIGFSSGRMTSWPSASSASAASSAMVPAEDGRKLAVAVEVGELVMDVLRRGQRPSEVMTKQALENAIAAVAMSGGSTNAVLHLLAVARELGVPLEIDEFERLIPQARKVIFRDTGHMAMLERPQTFNDCMMEFLAEETSPAASEASVEAAGGGSR